MAYTSSRFEIRETEEFARWRAGLRDLRAAAQVSARIRRLSEGLPGDTRPVGASVSELRIHTGPGYRIYYTRKGPALILLLCGGDKRTQSQDITRAVSLARIA